jgi:uncharacterized tellurite resistance protein B-like protein
MSRPDTISLVDALAFIYVGMSTADGEVDTSEVQTIAVKLSEWIDGDVDGAMDSIKKAGEWRASTENWGEDVVLCCNYVKSKFSEANLKALMQDLATIAGADGDIHEGEQAYFNIMNDVFFGE